MISWYVIIAIFYFLKASFFRFREISLLVALLWFLFFKTATPGFYKLLYPLISKFSLGSFLRRHRVEWGKIIFI